MRRKFKLLAALVAAFGLALFVSSPASAAPYWQPVNTNDNWHCEKTQTHSASDNVGFQTCIVLNQYGDEQVVLVVVNNASTAIKIEGWMYTNFGGNAHCNESWLNPGRQTGCLGPTVAAYCGANTAYSVLRMNSRYDDTTDTILVDPLVC
jgi:hypothetical protein